MRIINVSTKVYYSKIYPTLSPHGTGPGGFPRPGDAETDKADATAEAGRKVGLHLSGGG